MRPKDKQPVKDLHQRLARREPISDDEILSILGEVSVMTNAEQVAIDVMGIIAPICGFRDHLTSQLLPHVLHPLVALGVEQADRVIGWLKHHLKQKTPFDVHGEEAIAWIEKLTLQPETIQTLLDEAIKENDMYFVEETIERYSPHIRIPLDRVDFHYYWSEYRLSKLSNAVLFFDLGVWDDVTSPNSSETIIEKLTEAFGNYDPNGLVRIVIFNADGYTDFRWHYEEAKSVFPSLKVDEVQLLWLHEGKILHIMKPTQIEFSVIEHYTLDLLRKLV